MTFFNFNFLSFFLFPLFVFEETHVSELLSIYPWICVLQALCPSSSNGVMDVLDLRGPGKKHRSLGCFVCLPEL